MTKHSNTQMCNLIIFLPYSHVSRKQKQEFDDCLGLTWYYRSESQTINLYQPSFYSNPIFFFFNSMFCLFNSDAQYFLFFNTYICFIPIFLSLYIIFVSTYFLLHVYQWQYIDAKVNQRLIPVVAKIKMLNKKKIY